MDEKRTASPDDIPSAIPVGAHVVQSTYIKPQARKLYDPDVSFEEYHYWALKTREEEVHYDPPKNNIRQLLSGKRKSAHDIGSESNGGRDPSKDHTEINFASRDNRIEISDEEWANASRAFRTASTGAAFFLITTDILGPYGVGFALGTLGWGPGIALYTVFGVMTGYSGYLVWHVFVGVDSYQFPARNYGDLAFRTWGTTARYVVNFIQALALLLLLGQVTIQFGENISQMSKFRLCYVVCPLIFVIAGFFMTQIRTLKNYGWVANLSVWTNLLAIFISMGVFAHSPPNYAISVLGSSGSAVDPDSIKPFNNGTYPPLVHYAGLPANNLVGSINGLLNGVLAYAGVQLFVEFMAEMRRPMDFLKVMWGAEFFIYAVYMIYGCFIYYYQGQYSFYPSYQGISIYGWQTACNAITLVGALIAAGLYGNIGIKVFYNNILMEMLSAPPLITRSGKILYAVIVPVWWSIAFVIAAAIPDYFGFVSVISASCLLNLTYSIPPFLALGFDLQKNTIKAGEGFDPNSGQVIRFRGLAARWFEGFWSGGIFQVCINIWHVLYFLCALAMCGLGMYAAVDGLIEVFKNPVVNSFSCVSPLNLAAQGG